MADELVKHDSDESKCAELIPVLYTALPSPSPTALKESVLGCLQEGQAHEELGGDGKEEGEDFVSLVL